MSQNQAFQLFSPTSLIYYKLIVSSQRKPMNASEDSMEFHEFDRKSCKIYHSCLVHVHVDDKNF